MYGWIWRHIPGPLLFRILTATAVAIGVFFLLMEVVFPWVETLMPYGDVSVGEAG